MREFFKSKRFKVLLAFIAFLVGVMVYSVTKGGYSVSGKSIINTVSKPFRSISNSISMKIEGSMDKLERAEEIYDENQSLKEEIMKLQEQLTDYESLKIECEELRMLIGIKQAHPDLTTSRFCKILSYVTNDPFKSFTINVGSADGIEPYCPVATAEGIVGITIEVSEHVTTVRTILSPDLSIAVKSKSCDEDSGIIEGSVKLASDGMTRLIHLRTDNTLKKNDLLITDGSSGLFPKGYSVGKVKSVDMDSNGLSACAEVEPCVDVTKLESVFVITNFTGKRGNADED
ncbi:MAG: rod shape-determining protein MreC [Ruminococcus flavefaciens]|nr:rod shape-determining protein MreC [Ruminococcus flavefaciens]